MKGRLLTMMILFAGATSVNNVVAQSALEEVLMSVEDNNLQLKAERQLVDAKSFEARVGNSLSNPSVDFEHRIGSPASKGKENEISVKQEFEFPTTYINQNRLAKTQRAHFENQYLVTRQEVLLEVKNLYIDLVAAVRVLEVDELRCRQADRIVEFLRKRLQAGDASRLDLQRAEFEALRMHRQFEEAELRIKLIYRRLKGLNGGERFEFENGRLLADENMLDNAIPTQEEAVERYLAQNPTSAAARTQIDIARNDLKLSRSRSLPKFEVGYVREFAVGEHFDGVALGMSIPMFGNKNNVKRAAAYEAAAESQYREYEMDLQVALAELYFQEEMLRRSSDLYSAAETEMERYVARIWTSFEVGEMSLTNYYTELQLRYDIALETIELRRQHRGIIAAINSIEL